MPIESANAPSAGVGEVGGQPGNLSKGRRCDGTIWCHFHPRRRQFKNDSVSNLHLTDWAPADIDL
jgi:hypothetical protein